MKLLKLLPIFLFVIFIAGFVSANMVVTYNFVDKKTNIPQDDVDALVMTCGDALCTESTIKTPTFKNTGNSNDSPPNTDIKISYPTIQETPSGYALYFYKSGYLPLEYFVKAYSDGTRTVQIPFEKKQVCSAQIDDFQIINVAKPNIPLVINMRASLDATTHSAFATNLNTPYYTPPQYVEEFYSAQTKIELKIYDSNNNIVFSQQKTVNIRADKSVDVSFTWIPNKSGEYRAVISTDVTDDQCASSQKQESTKIFDVLGEEPKNSCYTILNNLKTSDDKPFVGEKLTVSANKISNYATSAGLLSPVTTQVSAQIFRETSQVDSRILNLQKNQDATNPKEFSFEFTPDREGLYTIRLNGVSNDPLCSGLTNIDDTITQTFFVQRPALPTLSINEIPDMHVDENKVLIFNIETVYTGSLKLTYRVAVPDDAGSFRFDERTQTFIYTPSFDTVKHPDVNFIVTLKRFIVSNFGLPLFRDVKVIFQVTDGIVTASREATIKVLDVNRNPTIQPIQDLTVQVGQKITIQPITTDEDGDKVRLTFSSPLDAAGSFTPNQNDLGVHEITIRAFDAFGGAALVSFKITVVQSGGNHPPVLSTISDKIIEEEKKLEFSLHATDLDNDPLTFFAQNLPASATLDANTGKFTWTPTHSQIGVYFVTFGVSDSKVQDTQLVKITVRAKGTIPPPTPLVHIGSHKVDITSLVFMPDYVRKGGTLETFVYVKNMGSEKQKSVVLTLTVPELSIVQQKTLDLSVKQEQLVIFESDIPSNILKGQYILYISVYDKTSSVVKIGEFKVI